MGGNEANEEQRLENIFSQAYLTLDPGGNFLLKGP